MNPMSLCAARPFVERTCARMVLFCATLLTVGVSADAARAQTFATPINISHDGFANAPQVLVDSHGNVDIAYAETTASSMVGSVRFVGSDDGGKTFSKPVDIASNGASSFSMALEGECTIDVAYFQKGDVFLSQSRDCGKTFAPTNVTQSNGTTPPIQSIQMAVNAGTAQVAWVGNDLKLRFAQRTSNGTFTVPVVLFTQVEGNIGLAPMTVSNGTTDMVWSAGEFNCQLFFLSSFNGAQPAQVLPGSEDLCGAVPFAVDSAGNVNIAWRDFDRSGSHVIRFVRSAGQTGNFGPPKSISDGSQPEIAITPGGKIALAWASGGAVAFSNSADGGNTFSAPLKVALAPNGASVSAPQLALHGDAFAAIAWEQVPDSGQGSDLWFSQSSDGGSTFSPAVNVTKNQSSPSAVRMIADSAGNVLMVWSANVSNGHDIFFAKAAAAGAGFTMSATPAALMAVPGGSATAQLTLTATGGFDQPVNFSCSGLPPGAACSFSPASAMLSGSGILVTVTLTVPAGLPTAGFPFTINAASPTISQFQDMQLSVGTPASSVTPAAATIPLGGTANFVVTVVSTANVAGQFNLACQAPAGVTCTFSPSSAFLPINGRATSTLTVQILSLPSSAAPTDLRNIFPPALPTPQTALPVFAFGILLGALAFGFLSRSRNGWFVPTRAAGVFVIIALATAMLSCGGSTTRTSFVGTGPGAVGTGGTSGFPGTPGIGGTAGSAGAGGTTTGGVTAAGSASVTFPLTVLALSGANITSVGTVSITVP
jgi:hypothetical protein